MFFDKEDSYLSRNLILIDESNYIKERSYVLDMIFRALTTQDLIEQEVLVQKIVHCPNIASSRARSFWGSIGVNFDEKQIDTNYLANLNNKTTEKLKIISKRVTEISYHNKEARQVFILYLVYKRLFNFIDDDIEQEFKEEIVIIRQLINKYLYNNKGVTLSSLKSYYNSIMMEICASRHVSKEIVKVIREIIFEVMGGVV